MSRVNAGLASRVRAFGLSPTVAMAQRAAALRAAGRSIIDLTVGEPDQSTPPHVVEAARKALAEGQTRYTSAAGLVELRKAVAARYQQDLGVRFEPEEVTVACGGKQALSLTCQALVDRGDEVVVQAGETGIRFLLVSGKPLEEPVAWYGPIVMNTQEELRQAFAEFQAGTFLKHD